MDGTGSLTNLSTKPGQSHKDDFDRVYNLEEPSPYYTGLRPSDYCMPAGRRVDGHPPLAAPVRQRGAGMDLGL